MKALLLSIHVSGATEKTFFVMGLLLANGKCREEDKIKENTRGIAKKNTVYYEMRRRLFLCLSRGRAHNNIVIVSMAPLERFEE